MLATVKPSSTSVGSVSPMCLSSGSPLATPVSPLLASSLTIHASATATALSDTDLTSLSWLQKPGVLTSMCTALTGSPHRVSKTGTRSSRKPRQSKLYGKLAAGGVANKSHVEKNVTKEADKMVNVILNVRNRRYNENGEEVHKPPLSFACMIFMALESSPTKTLPVKDIYDWIVWKFPFYRSASSGWKNSIRHNLSLNKCFRKVDRYSTRSKCALSKGGFWTVDPDYRRSLLAALERSPFHPYHSYLSPPLSPSSSSGSLESLDPAERDAALTMCMISGGPSDDFRNGEANNLKVVYHDHCYSKRIPRLPVTVKLRRRRKKGLTLDEIAAAAEMILAQEESSHKDEEWQDSSDEEVISNDSECEGGDDMECDLGDSGYGEGASPAMDTSLSMEEMGADALLCLASSSRSNSPPPRHC